MKPAAALEARNTDLYDRIRQLLRDDDFTALDAMLNPGDLSGATRPEMLGLLRYTRGHRHQLPGWHPFLAAVHSELAARGLNATDILAGIG
jgi:hypothetical protein